MTMAPSTNFVLAIDISYFFIGSTNHQSWLKPMQQNIGHV